MEIIKCFTDASYSKDIEMSVVGYKIGDDNITIEHLPKIKNTQAELYAVSKNVLNFILNVMLRFTLIVRG